MRLRLLCMTVAAISLSACATVDMTNMTGTTSAVAAQSDATQGNVVKRAAKSLYAAFTTKGWAAKASRKRVQSTASVLLKGLEDQTEAQKSGSYLDTVPSYEMLSADIRAAEQHVYQTTKAAEVYLSMSGASANIRSELASLEKALIAARQAEIVFETALTTMSRSTDADFKSYCDKVDALRDVTDQYGDRVRGTATRVSALDFAVN